MNTLELFCGTKSFSKVAKERGFGTFTTDIDSDQDPDLCKNILDITIKDLPKDIFVLWASPPCQGFSVASMGIHWFGNYQAKTSICALGIAYVLKTLELIKEIKPRYWFIENPRGVLRKMPMMANLRRNTITYCQYGDKRMKPTDIWNNCYKWISKPMCKNNDPCHEGVPRGINRGTIALKKIDRSRIPPGLFHEIFDAIKNAPGAD